MSPVGTAAHRAAPKISPPSVLFIETIRRMQLSRNSLSSTRCAASWAGTRHQQSEILMREDLSARVNERVALFASTERETPTLMDLPYSQPRTNDPP
jgi:hypothetical protein